jgi:glutamate dehydrogenase
VSGDLGAPATLAGPGPRSLRSRPTLALEGGAGAGGGRVRCTVTWPGELPLLADVIPAFEQLGVRVADHSPLQRADRGGAGARDAFDLLLPEGRGNNGGLVALRSAFAAAWSGETELDGLSRLVLTAGIPWRELTVIRAACRYLRQAGLGLSPGYVEETVRAWPEFVRVLLKHFAARFDPDATDPAAAAAAAADLDERLGATTSLDEDRILGGLRDVLAAVQRTNFYQCDGAGSPKLHLSLKIDSKALPFLPRPWPWVETFVSSPQMEGLHLRGARVARGGIRWSNRPEDYRTEVLGLLKAQMVKNAVIVPAGAKGAFVVRGSLAGRDRDGVSAIVRLAYSTFVRGLLDITDTVVNEQVVHPDRCVVLDGLDPYLVIAADKGTATFSDLANSLAAEYGFWLGDAFASGGSLGFDHKAMGITARGAWVSVRRHFRELGTDIDTEPVTVVGIGDMSGDVFGNGVLLSRALRLVGAFDHRHIFLDPDPDPVASYAERARLARLPSSSWADYDPTVLSPGGGVYPRDAKAITLSAQAGARLEVAEDELTPTELIQALLRAPVDLLWNGGIGTYVKASQETHRDAGDRVHDPVRVDADTLRCRVVGEGGNLGLTQPARVEFALHGGHLNTDFIDNSAGVDTSDREVNLKILLDAAVADGELGRAERDELLASLTDEVATAVLADNEKMTRAISACAAQAPFLLDRHARLIHNLEEHAGLDRALEHLPTETEIERRRAGEQGLTRPEVAVLLAYSKNRVREELLDSDLPDEPKLADAAAAYFPAVIRKRFTARIRAHPLIREISATALANDLINRVGPGFLYRLEERTGAGTPPATRAFAAVHDIFDLDPLWELLDGSADTLAPEIEQFVMREIQRLTERGSDWLLRHARRPTAMAAAVRRLGPSVRQLTAGLRQGVPASAADHTETARTYLSAAAAPTALTDRVVLLRPLAAALDIAEVATDLGADVESVADIHFLLGRHLDLDWLDSQIVDAASDAHWVLAAKASLREDLAEQWNQLTRAVVTATDGPANPADGLPTWLDAHTTASAAFTAVRAELSGARRLDVAMLTVAGSALRRLVIAGDNDRQ